MASTQDVRIDVTGEAELLLPAERAVLKVSVIRTEFDKQSAAEATIESAKKVETLLRSVSALKNGQVAAVDYWSRTSLSETSHVPYDHEEKVHLEREYTASIKYDISLQRFERLGPVIHDLVAINNVSSNGVTWELTHDTIEAQKSKLRRMAAKNALVKAQDYAEALGYKKIFAVQATEAQMYTHSSNRKTGMMPTDGIDKSAKNMAEAEDWEHVGDEAFQYTPEGIKITQKATVKFAAE